MSWPSCEQPTPEQIADAQRVVDIVSASPGLSAERIARQLNAMDVLGERAGRPLATARRVREMIWLARDSLAAPIIAKAGLGYRLAGDMAEAMAYAEETRRLGREWFAVADRVERAARRRFERELPLGTSAGPG